MSAALGAAGVVIWEREDAKTEVGNVTPLHKTPICRPLHHSPPRFIHASLHFVSVFTGPKVPRMSSCVMPQGVEMCGGMYVAFIHSVSIRDLLRFGFSITVTAFL